jgi:hypothetical protein
VARFLRLPGEMVAILSQMMQRLVWALLAVSMGGGGVGGLVTGWGRGSGGGVGGTRVEPYLVPSHLLEETFCKGH